MGETTGISWTDHTFNPWIGCTKVSAGCKLCYAENQNTRYNWNPEGWGKGRARKRTSEANWKKPVQWAKQAEKDHVTRRVFCASLADVFDNEVDPAWRKDLWWLIDSSRYHGPLEWLLLTKRPHNIRKMLIPEWLEEPPSFLRIGTTVEDKNNYYRIENLLDVWRGKNFLSCEPLLSSLDLTHDLDGYIGNDTYSSRKIHWVIVGGESGAGCRPMNLDWARAIRDQCIEADAPFFFKQIGGYPDKRHNPDDWPEDLRIQQFPEY